jgi:hypothetical protein
MLLISEAIDFRSFLHKHAEHAEYHRTPVPSSIKRSSVVGESAMPRQT